MHTLSKRSLYWLWLSALVIILDQTVKLLVVYHLGYGQPLVLTSFLNLLLSYNAGASFGFLKNSGGWQVYFFSVIAILASVFFIIWLMRTPYNSYWRALGLSLIVGGAMGNLLDRLRLTYVIDFIDFHIKGWHFATFNLADCAISVGVFCLLLSFKFRSKVTLANCN